MKSILYKSTTYQLRSGHAIAISQPEYRFLGIERTGRHPNWSGFVESMSPAVVDTLPAARFIVDLRDNTIELQEPLLTKEEREEAIVEIMRALGKH